MAVEFKDYYRALEVSRTASTDEIRKTFRKLARRDRPDVAKNKAQAGIRFKEINEAYEVLSDPEKRKRYDKLGVDWKRAVQPASTRVPPDLKFVLGSAALVIIVLLSFLLLPNRPKIGKAVTNDSKTETTKLVDALLAAPTNDPDRTKIAVVPAAPTNAVTLGDESELATEYSNQGTQKLEQGKLDEAIALYAKALELHHDDEDIYYNLGIAYARKGNAAEAKRYYLEALRIVPDYAEAHNNLGNVLVGQSQFEEANQHFEAALKALPEYASAHNNYGTALRVQGKPAEALEHFSAAVRFSPDYVEAHFNLGNVLLSLDRVDEAIKEFTEVLRLRPDFPPAVQRLAQAREKQTAGSPDK